MRPTEATFVPLLVVSKVNKSVKRLSIIEQGMEEYNVQPNKRVLDAAVRYYTAIGELDKGKNLLGATHSLRNAIDVHPYTILS